MKGLVFSRLGINKVIGMGMILKSFAFIMLISIHLFSDSLTEKQKMAIADRNFKEAIALQRQIIAHVPENEKTIYNKYLAVLYLKDQDQEQAFRSFLKALDEIQPVLQPPAYDSDLYKKMFAIYLNPGSESTQEVARNLIQAVLPVLNGQPDRLILEYFAAIAYANLGKYEEFFNHFYAVYPYYPVHYLAYKTKAVLHIKLLERTRGEAERGVQRKIIVDNLLQALAIEPYDTAIYKMIISFSPPEKKKEQVELCLNKIINGNIMIPRKELMFYVVEAVDVNDTELAKRFIARSKEWYPQSRIVDSAQNYLDAHK